jgi:hypothetical protein
MMGRMADIEISGEYGYCAMPSGLEIVYLADSSLTVVSDLYLAGCAQGLDIRSQYVYLADGFSGLRIIDVTDPLNPILTGTYDTPTNAADVQVLDDNIAYVADGSGIVDIDISDPTNPILAGSYISPIGSCRIAIENSLAFMACSENDLHILDVSSAHWPQDLCGMALPGDCLDVCSQDSLIFTANSSGGAHVINAANPLQPEILSVIPGHRFTGLAVRDSVLFSADSNRFEIYNIVNPISPFHITGFDVPVLAQKIFLDGPYAYIVDSDFGLLKIDISDPDNPRRVGSLMTGKNILDLNVCGNYAYTSDGDFKIVDISDPHYPRIIGSLNLPEFEIGAGFAISGEDAYINMSSPGSNYLGIVDISNKMAPVLIGACSVNNIIYKVAIQGNYAYVAVSNAGVIVIDISNPIIPTRVATFPEQNFVTDIQVVGNYAYVLDQNHYLHIIEISNPLNPVMIGEFHTDNIWLTKIFISGQYAFLLDHYFRLTMVNISNPRIPVLVSNFYFSYPSYLYDIYVDGNYVFVGLYYEPGYGGDLFVVDISNPESLSIACNYPLADYSNAVCYSDGFVYVGSPSSLLILQFVQTGIPDKNPELPKSIFLEQNYPNPFNGMTTIKYSLSDASYVTIEIYDLLGRKMGLAYSGFKDAGLHTVLWDSDNAPGGVYFYQINAGKQALRKKMILLK